MTDDKQLTKNLIFFMNFFIVNFKFIIGSIIISSLSVIIIFNFFIKEEVGPISYNSKVFLHADYSVDFFIKELQRSITFDLNIANEKLLSSSDMSQHYIDGSGMLVKSKKSDFSFSNKLIQQLHRDPDIYPTELIRNHVRRNLDIAFFKNIINQNKVNKDTMFPIQTVQLDRDEDENERIAINLFIRNLHQDLDNLAIKFQSEIKNEITKILKNYLQTYVQMVLTDKNLIKVRYERNKADWILYYEDVLNQKIRFLENQVLISEKIAQTKFQSNIIDSDSFNNEGFLKQYYLTEPIMVELDLIKKIKKNKQYDKFIPHFTIHKLYFDRLNQIEPNIKLKIFDFEKLLEDYVNVNIIDYTITYNKSSPTSNFFLIFFLIVLFNLFIVLVLLIRGFYVNNKNLLLENK